MRNYDKLDANLTPNSGLLLVCEASLNWDNPSEFSATLAVETGQALAGPQYSRSKKIPPLASPASEASPRSLMPLPTLKSIRALPEPGFSPFWMDR